MCLFLAVEIKPLKSSDTFLMSKEGFWGIAEILGRVETKLRLDNANISHVGITCASRPPRA